MLFSFRWSECTRIDGNGFILFGNGITRNQFCRTHSWCRIKRDLHDFYYGLVDRSNKAAFYFLWFFHSHNFIVTSSLGERSDHDACFVAARTTSALKLRSIRWHVQQTKYSLHTRVRANDRVHLWFNCRSMHIGEVTRAYIILLFHS